MAIRDFNKGMEAGAKPFEEKFKKQSQDFEKVAQNINQKLDDINFTNDSIIDDLNSIEKKRLYDLNTIIDIAKLGDDEKELLMADLYTLANLTDQITEYQQDFLRSVKNYLNVKNVQTSIDLSTIENIENINDQKAILQVVMEFLFLKSGDFDFLEELQEEIFDYFSINKKGYNEIRTCIIRVYKATGFEGISEKYGYVVLEEEKQNEENNNDNEVSEAYDGSDICEACADIININENYVTLNDYIVYCDEKDRKIYKVSKNDGKKIEINLDVKFSGSSFLYYSSMLGCGDNLFLVVKSENNFLDQEGDILIKLEINTYKMTKIKLVGENRGNPKCSKDYFTYLGTFENVSKLVKIDLKDNSITPLELNIKHWTTGDNSEYYLLGKIIYYKSEGLLNKFNLEDGSVEKICEISNATRDFLERGNTDHYRNKLFTVCKEDNFGFSYIDISNPTIIRIESIPDYVNDVYAFTKYGNIFYVKLDSRMPICKFNINTGEVTVILETTQCADSYTTGIIRKEKTYYMLRRKPQVVGKWLYYVGRDSNKVRKVSIDAKIGKSKELFIDGKPVLRPY